MKIFSALFFLLLFVSSFSYAQDLKAGEITVQHISGFTYKANIILYQNISTIISRPAISLDWGDATQSILPGDTANCSDTSTFTSIYSATHTYNGNGNYIIHTVDSFRIANLANIPNSGNETMNLEYDLVINPFLGFNSSPIYLFCVHDASLCCNYTINDLSGYDIDGDSLSYTLIAPSTNYTFPPATLDSTTGFLTFNPVSNGLYAFCMRVDEWRYETNIGSTLRQIQMDVYGVTDINENSFSNNISVYPNPFHSYTNLSFRNVKQATLELYNNAGQLVRSINNITGGNVKIERDQLNEGFYYYILKTDKKLTATGKLVIM
jgi:hypothetical protein